MAYCLREDMPSKEGLKHLSDATKKAVKFVKKHKEVIIKHLAEERKAYKIINQKEEN